MKNRLSDLNNHLFAQIERLSDENLTAEQIEIEAKRSAAIVACADQIVSVGDLTFRAAKLLADHGARVAPHLPMLEGKGGRS